MSVEVALRKIHRRLMRYGHLMTEGDRAEVLASIDRLKAKLAAEMARRQGK